jgi:hypothetical protein
MKIHVPKGLGPQPVPGGSYRARISKVELGVTKSSGKDMINFEYTILSNGPGGETTIGRKVFDNPVVQENTMWRINIPFQACTGEELPEGDYSIDEFFMIIKNSCLNKEVIVDVAVEIIKEGARAGEETNKLTSVHSMNGGGKVSVQTPKVEDKRKR